MRGAAGELADRLHFLRLTQSGFRSAALGDVPRNFGVTHQTSVAMDGVDDDVGPKTAAILAQTPPLRFQSALPSRGAKPRGRNSSRPVLLGIKTLEILADDFRRFVALDAFRTRISTHDAPVRIQPV